MARKNAPLDATNFVVLWQLTKILQCGRHGMESACIRAHVPASTEILTWKYSVQGSKSMLIGMLSILSWICWVDVPDGSFAPCLYPFSFACVHTNDVAKPFKGIDGICGFMQKSKKMRLHVIPRQTKNAVNIKHHKLISRRSFKHCAWWYFCFVLEIDSKIYLELGLK